MIKVDFIKKALDDKQTHEVWFYYIDGNSKCEYMILSYLDVEYYGDKCLVVATKAGIEIINLDLVKKVIIG